MAINVIDTFFTMLTNVFVFMIGNPYLGVIVVGWLISMVVTFYLRARNS